MNRKTMKELHDKLKVGTKIRIGVKYAESETEYNGLKANEVIELIEGEFDEDNGLYCYTSYTPSIKSRTDDDFDSIYHLFGNNLEKFMDCEVL